MVETDWRELLSFSQRELRESDKEKLCESLSWMEADDIELNFTDLKTLFRLAQDILKFKNEQVNNLLGQLETQSKSGKGKVKGPYVVSPTRSNDSVLDTIADQEDVIKANKEILEQLYADIAELEGKKSKLEEKKNDDDTESSRDALSEMDAVAQLENEITMKNRHIRKLLGDVKVLEDDNNKLKEKLSVLKDKLTEATAVIENLTDQVYDMNTECAKLKENLGYTKQSKTQISVEIDTLKKELQESETKKESFLADIKAKAQHWKDVARAKRSEIEALETENTKLKEELIQTPRIRSPKHKLYPEEYKLKELQDKLSEASYKLLESARLIERLKSENEHLKLTLDDTAECSTTDVKNESDEGKERIIINKLKKKVKSLTAALSESDGLIASREKELAEMAARLQLVEKNEGVKAFVDGLKQKKQQLKTKNEELRKLVKDINSLNETVDHLQLENESMRQKLNIHPDEAIDSKDVVSKYQVIGNQNVTLTKELRVIENKLISVELENRSLVTKLNKLQKFIIKSGYGEEQIEEISNDEMPMDGGGESSCHLASVTRKSANGNIKQNVERDAKMQAVLEENEGLRKGLQDILNFLKDNSTTSSGILALQCPSLEAVLHSMEARHAAGWLAPHMAAVMELKEALGGKDALLSALHEARKETFDVMDKLSRETKKTTELENRISLMESKSKSDVKDADVAPGVDVNMGEFGSWIGEEHDFIEFNDNNEITNYIERRNSAYENQLKSGLSYFHNKLNTLYNKMTALAVQASDDQNNWRIEEEHYKAQIENLKSQIVESMNDSMSENSPGLINIPNAAVLERRCSYLEENYKHIRTVNENIRNELLDCQRDAMLAASQYEAQVNRFIITVADLTDRLRKSISIDLFWKQNYTLSDVISKYRKLLNVQVNAQDEPINLINRLEKHKMEILNSIREYFQENCTDNDVAKHKTSMETDLLQKQIQELCKELNEKEKQIKILEEKNVEYQNLQGNLIDDNLASLSHKDVKNLRDQFSKITTANKSLKEEIQHTNNQLNIALLQLQDTQHKHLDNDMEINLLRHQILDLQSTGDNKAIVARLSGEILVAHLQASELQKKIDKMNITLTNERRMRIEAEEMFEARQNIFNLYAHRYETKFRYLYEVMQVLRQQYHGCIPLTSIENYQNNLEELSRKTYSVNAKLNEIEDLHTQLIIKHNVYEQILDISKNKCLEENDTCQHKLQLFVTQSKYSRETDYLNKKIQTLEQSAGEITKHCNYLEKTLLLVNQGLDKSSSNIILGKNHSNENINAPNIEVEDLISDDDFASRRSLTITLPKPKVLKPTSVYIEKPGTYDAKSVDLLPGSPVKTLNRKEKANVLVQTSLEEKRRINKFAQTDKDLQIPHLNKIINDLKTENEKKTNEIVDSISLAKQQSIDILKLNTENVSFQTKIKDLHNDIHQRDTLIKTLNESVEDLRRQLDSKDDKISKSNEKGDSVQQENKSLLVSLKKIEKDKNAIVEEYQKLIKSEREEYAKSMKDLQTKILELQIQLERRGNETDASYPDKLQEVAVTYSHKILELEDECFNLRNKLDGSKSELISYQSEMDRWKNLASERLTKMEQLSSQLEERHFHEVESYKAENQHWLTQLSETQREHLGLRTKLSEQKAVHIKQLADKDVQIEQLRCAIHTLKSQIMNMQTIMAVNDPSFDLSAIVEVEEVSDGVSQQGSERLELKFDSALDLQDLQDDARLPATSSTIWQEPILERLRREKQLISKQNGMLRRQIKALASRERRARLDAHNLKNQVFRISTSGSRVATAETAALHNKIATLTAQLSSARRDTNSNVALWDKWKKAQQSSDRWQTRYEDKCQEVKKLEASLLLAKSTLLRLEKEKRVLLSRLNEVKHESKIMVEKQEGEYSEKSLREPESARYDIPSPLPVSSRALLDRVEAQQRRIAALEVAEKGNEILVSEYEKSLAEITVLKGQVLKLESSLLESQIRSPMKTAQETQPELDYWKSYCEMLKEENMNLTMRINNIEISPTSSTAPHHQQRVNDLEQTILTLRGLVSKLQSEQKSSALQKRTESSSRPSSGRSGTDKTRHQLEPYRVEIANLKRSIQDKDLLLEKSKEMLKIAAEREEDLLQENTYLSRRLEELTKRHEGFLSA